ncbi:synaptoproteinsis syg-2-like isoform X1 [Solea senegalensis]|uniref:Synaptoproteinsis syg-2-like isoform X1 n=3 Tax=Solea senegalensis TaxID=28829 RepID=A0AAV6Q2U2_SOLSE|nr:uncharacterized protein si:ch211-149e23.4 [Solea senegalensis]KAG7480142.1 synaptoproteinsis syg-2-like isoform X1 [Solea senegalensis]
MRRSGLLILGLLLNVAHCLGILGASEEPYVEVTDVTAVLGEVAYLSCRYQGQSEVQSAHWVRQLNSRLKSKKLAGFSNGQLYSSSDLSVPHSVNNLTVRMTVSSVAVEGEYICEFETEEGTLLDRAYVTVVARPDIQVLVSAETVNGTHYQSVSCVVGDGRPAPQITWLVNNLPPSDPQIFTVSESDVTAHSNGTFSQSSTLRFPTHLQDEDSVTCAVRHPTLPNPKLTTVRVETYARPNVTIKAEMVQKGGNEFWVVSCISSGGRPDTDIWLSLNCDEEPQRENSTDSDTGQSSSVVLPATAYEGCNVTCVFDHPKFTHTESRAVTLPSFYLSGVQLINSESTIDGEGAENLQLREGESEVVIGLEVTGNVPRYDVTCTKDAGPLPEGLELVGSYLTVHGPVEQQRHAGLYECVVSYHHLKATVHINITVHVPPRIRVDLQTKGGHRVIECSADDAVPAANVSWLLPKGVSGVSWSNFTSHNGSHSVRGVILLPACSPRELTAECVINHPAFEEPESRSITLPHCAQTNITINSSTDWRHGEQFTQVDCSADSVAPAPVITWYVGNSDNSITSNLSETEVKADGSVSARSSVHFLSSLYAGQNLTCMVEHPSTEAAENRTIHIPAQKAPQLSVSLVRQQDSHLWLAVCSVCECRGEGVETNLTWVLPENAKGQTSLHAEYEGHSLKTRLTYQFPLALHEGQDLTCVYQFKHGVTERRTVHVPRYYISAVRVLNHTTPLRNRHADAAVIHRLTLQENHHNQRILLRVEGNVPQYDLSCKRSGGALVRMEGLEMVFPSEITEEDRGLYTCCASFYHHAATVKIQVEVMSESKLFGLIALTCLSVALTIISILAVTLWVCCTRNNRKQNKKRGSLSALTSQMQEPGSPEVKKPAVMENESKEYAQLLSYSIVIDVKSTV